MSFFPQWLSSLGAQAVLDVAHWPHLTLQLAAAERLLWKIGNVLSTLSAEPPQFLYVLAIPQIQWIN